jgi:hypothetical protein
VRVTVFVSGFAIFLASATTLALVRSITQCATQLLRFHHPQTYHASCFI